MRNVRKMGKLHSYVFRDKEHKDDARPTYADAKKGMKNAQILHSYELKYSRTALQLLLEMSEVDYDPKS
jgi:hypothetical protein